MPVYEFLCRDCDHRFDDLVGLNEDVEARTCSECNSSDVVKLYSPFKVGAKAGVSIDGTGATPGGCGGAGACLPGEPGASAGSGRKGGCCGGSCGAC